MKPHTFLKDMPFTDIFTLIILKVFVVILQCYKIMDFVAVGRLLILCFIDEFFSM